MSATLTSSAALDAAATPTQAWVPNPAQSIAPGATSRIFAAPAPKSAAAPARM